MPEVRSKRGKDSLRAVTITYGNYNRNVIIRIPRWARKRSNPDVKIKVRTPMKNNINIDIRAWTKETQILTALAQHAPDLTIPRAVMTVGRTAIHTYIPGRPLSQSSPPGQPVTPGQLDQIVKFFGLTASIPVSAFPALPANWPRDRDSTGFLAHLAEFTETNVHRTYRAEFGTLFNALNIPENTIRTFKQRIRPMTPRPFMLLHADLHRDNIIVQPDGTLYFIDWELAMIGDPLHEIATHLYYMKYPVSQENEVFERLAREIGENEPEKIAGIAQDIGQYLGYKRVHSFYTDTIRAARTLGVNGVDAAVDHAAAVIEYLLTAAHEPLRLPPLPTRGQIRDALMQWHAAHRRGE